MDEIGLEYIIFLRRVVRSIQRILVLNENGLLTENDLYECNNDLMNIDPICSKIYKDRTIFFSPDTIEEEYKKLEKELIYHIIDVIKQCGYEPKDY